MAADPGNVRKGRRFPVRQYVLINLVFYIFCIVQLLPVQFVLRETRGLYFFFGLLMFGFLVVSVFDFLYDRYMTQPDESGT